jgi:restriction system protein
MGRRKSLAEDLVEVASYLPWWVSLVIAVAAWFILGAYAGSPVPVTPENPLASVSGAVPRAFAQIGKYLVSAAFLIGAVISLGRAWRNGRLLRGVASRSVDGSTCYHGDDADPLMTMSWREFEHLVGEIYRRRGYAVMETPQGADGGIDIVARRDGEVLLVQCKQWRMRDVGVSVVRELLGVVTAKGASRGAVVTVGRFTEEARRFARQTPIELVDGEALRVEARKVGGGAPRVTAVAPPAMVDVDLGCPVCHAPMVRRVAKRGANAGNAFLGCSRYPGCRGTRAVT